MFSRTMKRAGVAAAALGLTVALASCSGGDPLDDGGDPGTGDAGALTIGSQAFPESELLAQIYGQVLAANGYDVSYQNDVGPREVYVTALQDGSVDIVPDYAGNLLVYADPENEARSAEDVAAALPAAVESLGLAIANPSEGENSDALVVTPEYAEANDLTTIGDLAPLASSITLGSNTEFEPRWRDALAEVYGFEGWTFKAIDDGGGPATLADLLAGGIQVANIYTTTPSIAENDLVVLEDDRDMFAAQNLTPVLNADVLTDEIKALLDEVSALITTDVLLELNGEMAGDARPSAADVAEAWLTEQGLL